MPSVPHTVPHTVARRSQRPVRALAAAVAALLLLAGASEAAPAAKPTAPRWTVEPALNGKVTVKSRVGRREAHGKSFQLVEYEAKGRARASYDAVVATLRDISQHKAFRDESKSEVLEQLGKDRWLAYYYFDAPWPFTDFDYVMDATLKEDGATRTATLSMVTVGGKRPKASGVDRVDYYLLDYTVRQLDDGEVELTIASSNSPATEVPAVLIRSAFPDSAAEELQRLVKRAGGAL